MAGKKTSLTLTFLVHLPCVFPAFHSLLFFFCHFMALLRIISAFVNTRLLSPVLGSEDDNGNFLVQDCGLCCAGVPPPPPAHGLTGQLLFVSGLRLGGSASDSGANLLLEWLAGFCGSGSGSISACVLLGNGCAFRSECTCLKHLSCETIL